MDGRLVVIGPFHHPSVVACFFDNDGGFLGLERRLVPSETQRDSADSAAFNTRLKALVASWKGELGFKKQAIKVKPFFLKEYSIGIEEYPLDLADFLADPTKYSAEDQLEFLRDIEQWKREGNFIFFWSESYHLDRNGDSL
jgi:hypothetical protein